MAERDKGELGAHHAERLPAGVRSAMGHPFRRQILRILYESDGERSASELRECGCIPCTLSCIVYHLSVLADSGLVRRVPVGSVEGRLVHTFAADLDDQPAVREVLEATATADGVHQEPAQA